MVMGTLTRLTGVPTEAPECSMADDVVRRRGIIRGAIP